MNLAEDGSDQAAGAEVVVADDPVRAAFILSLSGEEVGRAEYTDRADGRRVFTHTEVDPGVGRRGLGSQLVRFALDEARQAGRSIVPQCPFVADFLRQHPDYADLAVSPRG